MSSSPVRGFRLNLVSLVCVWVALGCGENYVPLYDRPCEFDEECDDGLFCNGIEMCDEFDVCQPGIPPDVDDGVACTFDTCDEYEDNVRNLPIDTDCDDGLFCNGAETCDPNADCQPGALDIDDNIECTADSCDEDNDVVVHTLDNAACDDGQFCNGVELCSLGGCLAGDALPVDDSVSCTFDACDEALDMAVHIPMHEACDDADACTLDTCDPSFGCAYPLDPAADSACFACDAAIYNNGVYNLADGIRPNMGFVNNGVIEDFAFGPGASSFCQLRLTMLRLDGSSAHQQLRVRIYELGSGGITGLGNFATTLSVFDQTYRVSSGTLAITDTGDDAFGYSAFDYTTNGPTVNLGAGLYGLHISFPDEGGVTAFWATSPPIGNSENSAIWGDDVATPSDNGVNYQNLAFSFTGQSGAPVPLAPVPQWSEHRTSNAVTTHPAADVLSEYVASPSR